MILYIIIFISLFFFFFLLLLLLLMRHTFQTDRHCIRISISLIQNKPKMLKAVHSFVNILHLTIDCIIDRTPAHLFFLAGWTAYGGTLSNKKYEIILMYHFITTIKISPAWVCAGSLVSYYFVDSDSLSESLSE